MRNVLIEKTAGEMAAAHYEELRSQGYKSKYKNPKAYARANIEKYIPVATRVLTEMLGRNDVSEHMKKEIYEAIIDRVNDSNTGILDHLEKPQIPLKLN